MALPTAAKRVAKLMGEHRQELILPFVIFPKLFIQPAVLDCAGRHLRELHDEGLVVCCKLTLDFVQKLDDANAPAILAQQGRSQPSVHDLPQRLMLTDLRSNLDALRAEFASTASVDSCFSVRDR